MATNYKSFTRARFEKVAAARVNKIVDLLRLLANCSNKNNYTYDEEDVMLMMSTLTMALNETGNAFRMALNRKKSKFTFNKNTNDYGKD